MRKYLRSSTASIGFFVLFLLTGCKKEVAEPTSINPQEEEAISENFSGKFGRNSCRLKTLDWATVGIWQFHYNEKGLADQWIINYGPDLPLHTNAMIYDNQNRLIQSNEVYFGSNYEYRFYYIGKRLTRLTRTNIDFPDDATDFTFTYNWKGQNTRQDDNIHDQHVLMYYDAIGNCTQTDLYFGSDLIFSDLYTYNKPVRNPKSQIPGVDVGFPFYGTGGITDKWWFTSNKTIIYDNGNPILFNDYDPFKTRIKSGNKHLPITASYFDRVTESTVDITFDYDNCRRSQYWEYDGNSHDNKTADNDKIYEYTPSLWVRGSSKSIMEQIQKLKHQHKK